MGRWRRYTLKAAFEFQIVDAEIEVELPLEAELQARFTISSTQTGGARVRFHGHNFTELF